MPSMVAVANDSGPRLCYANDGPSSVITNTNAETAFDTIFTFPSQSQVSISPTSIVRIRAAGIFSTGLISLGFTLRTRWGGLSGTPIQSTGSFTLPASQTDVAWWIQGFVLINAIGASASMESQFFTAFDGNATMTNRQKNGSPIAFDNTSPADIVLTAEWAIATANNQISVRAMCIEIDRP